MDYAILGGVVAFMVATIGYIRIGNKMPLGVIGWIDCLMVGGSFFVIIFLCYHLINWISTFIAR